MSEDAPRGDVETVTLEQLRAAVNMRAAAYGHMFDVLSERFGAEAAVELLGEATRRLGNDMGAHFTAHGPADTAGLCDAFLGGIPGRDALFAPEVIERSDARMEIQFHRCPLKDFWVADGRSDEEVEQLCRAAGRIDGGLFERAGFVFKGRTWKPGQTGCCRLIVEPGPG
ncbi:MAG: L-2-amino-thiazoline-4-carboxylic acid hydrolase [Thalassobaculaceae bacterium]